ncbi:MAG TPA: sigma-70 family RNA polymerase sigma factor [Capillimicrobium sp.]|nr:sigma-70 family RNA polymerase sigma factor [Capillimicrobium sp.]
MAIASATDQLPERAERSSGRGARLFGPYSDRRLVARVRAGDEAAFERIFDRYAPGLVSFCRHMLGSLEEAEDAVQHVFVAAHRSMLASDRELHLRAWLYTIARNRCLSILRARREELALDDVDPGRVSTAGLTAEVERREDLRELLVDLQRLPDDQRAALVLAELGAHSHDEIAQVLDVRREKVKALVFQAREALAGARRARETPCEEIREQLATVRGSALRRAPIRRHLEVCPGCREFRDEVRRQRAALAVLLPVVPSAGLKAAVLGGSAVGGGSLLFAGKGATKLLATLALTGVAGGGGFVAVHELEQGGSDANARNAPARQEAAAPAPQAATAQPATTVSAAASTARPAGRPSGTQAGATSGDPHPASRQRDRAAPPRHPHATPGAATGAPGRSGAAPSASALAPGHAGVPARQAAPGHASVPARQAAPGQVKRQGAATPASAAVTPAPKPKPAPAGAAKPAAKPAPAPDPPAAPAAAGKGSGRALGHATAPGQLKKAKPPKD